MIWFGYVADFVCFFSAMGQSNHHEGTPIRELLPRKRTAGTCKSPFWFKECRHFPQALFVSHSRWAAPVQKHASRCISAACSISAPTDNGFWKFFQLDTLDARVESFQSFLESCFTDYFEEMLQQSSQAVEESLRILSTRCLWWPLHKNSACQRVSCSYSKGSVSSQKPLRNLKNFPTYWTTTFFSPAVNGSFLWVCVFLNLLFSGNG